MKHETKTVRKSDREVVSTRLINGPAHLVYEAWTKAELFAKWWVPKSFPVKLLSCELDVRVGGTYRLTFDANGQPMPFFGRYLEVVPNARLVWTNEEGGEAAMAVTTVTFEDRGGKTLITMSDLHPSKEALDEGIGATEGTAETFDQLELLLASP